MFAVDSVEYVRGYVLRIRFSDGVEGEVDLANELNGSVFRALRDTRLFAQASVHPELRTVVWPNGADLAPEFLRSILRAAA